MDESALVTAARSDPGRGFAAIYERYGDRIHDYCLAVLRQREDAADATQDTFLIAYERLGQLRDPSRLTPWLYAIARSRCLRRLKDRGRQRPTDDLEPLASAEPAATGQVEAAELRQLVWEAAGGLAGDDRAVLDLHLRQGLSGADLASALGVPAEKANLMLHRMKQRMGRTIGALLVARTGRADCPDLAALTTGQLTPLARKRLARHVDRCAVCRERRDRLAPELLYASVPLAPAPAIVGERFLDQVAGFAATGDTAGASGAMRWRDDGFPRPEPVRQPLPVPHRVGVAAGIAALAVLGLLGGGAVGRTLAGSDPPPTVPAAAASVTPGTAAPSDPPVGLPGAPGSPPAGPPGQTSPPAATATATPTPSPSPVAPPPTVQITNPTTSDTITWPGQPVTLASDQSDPLGQGLSETWSVIYPHDPGAGAMGDPRVITPQPLFPFGARWRPVDTFTTDEWCAAAGAPIMLQLEVRDGLGRTASDRVFFATALCPVVD